MFVENYERSMALQDPDEREHESMQLKCLSLCGLNLHTLITHPQRPIIDFQNLESLNLESCEGLDEAIPILTSVVTTTGSEGLLRLRSFTLRYEKCDAPFLDNLGLFLISINQLENPHVLLEGCSSLPILYDILMYHGKTLRSLVWDYRTKPRQEMVDDSMLLDDDYGGLRNISKFCPNLTALGITLSWFDLKRPGYYRNKVSARV